MKEMIIYIYIVDYFNRKIFFIINNVFLEYEIIKLSINFI